MSTRAIVRERDGVRLVHRPAETRPPPGWVSVRVRLAGICRTDVHAAEGLLDTGGPRVLGHELVGEVTEVEREARFAPGERVTASPLFRCGSCEARDPRVRCAEPRMLGVDVDGAFADTVVLPASLLHAVPRALPLRRAAYVEPLAAALAVVGAPVRKDRVGLVVGAGRIAELTVRVMHHRGFEVVRAPFGSSAGRFDHVIDTEGTERSLREALRRVRPGGVVVLKSRPASPVPLDVARAVRNDVTLAAVSYGPWQEAIELAGSLALDDLFGDVYPLERFGAALARTREEPLGPKVFLSPTGEA